MEKLVYEDLEPQSIEVEIGNKKYMLREADEAGACKYRNCLTSATKFDANGRPIGVDGLHDAEAVLVSVCLFEVYGNNNEERPVLLAAIRKWRHELVKDLFRHARRISGLEEKKEASDNGKDTKGDAEKNGQPATTAISV